MKENNKSLIARRSLVAGMSVAAAGLAAVGSTTASAQTTADFEPARHDLDAWMNELSGNHRVFIDTSSATGGVDALRYAFNILNAHENAYAGSSDDYAMIICYRHFSTPLGFNDAIWEKYGERFHNMMSFTDPATGEAPSVNFMNRGNGPTTIDALGARGIRFAICSSATRFIASTIAADSDRTTEEVIAELTAGAIENSRFVPAGVMAMTRAQEYHYSLLYAG